MNSIEIQAILPTFLLILGGKKMLLDYYKSLPDYISTIQLIELFEEFLFSISSRTIDVEIALESLFELSDRQWHTYELLDSDVKSEIETWIIGICNKESINEIELIASIIGRLGLVKVYKHLENLLNNDNVKNEVRIVIQETVAELDGHVEDPYFRMK
ncbi:hypothetical protein ACFORK_02715 [Paenibacillus sp. GCM10012306]